MIGIVLAGGTGSRLFPSTIGLSKHFCPVFDKPLFYYPLSLLLLLGIKKIIFVVNKEDLNIFTKKTKMFSEIGIQIKFAIQNKSKGLPDAILSAKGYIKNEKCCVVLGDNIFYGQNFKKIMKKQNKSLGASVFIYNTANSKEYAVATTQKNKVTKIIEKPKNSRNKNVVTGLYFFDHNLIKYCKEIKPSKRGELEIADVLNIYIKKNKLNSYKLGRGFTWFDAGTPKRLSRASSFIEQTENFTGLKISCLEEIALNNNWVSKNKIKKIIKKYPISDYKKYITEIIE